MNTNRKENAHLFYLRTIFVGADEDDITGTVEDAVALAVAKGCEVRGWKSGRANPTLFAFPNGTHHIVPVKRRVVKAA